MKIDITRCARCGNDHIDLEFKPLSRPMGNWTYWAACPVTGEPILLRVVPERQPKPGPSETKEQ